MQRSAQLGTEYLSETECREVLRGTLVGRLLTFGERSPEVIAVTYALVFDEVIFQYPADPQLPDIAHRSVTFESHSFTPGHDDDRSVYLRGVLRLIDDPWDIQGLEIIAPWICSTPSTHLRYFSMPTTFMTGIRSSANTQEISHLRLI